MSVRFGFVPPILAIALTALLSRTVAAEPRWTRLQSDHFVFVGNASERQIRDVALHLEQFRDALSRILPASAVVTSAPTIVYVFQSDASLTPYKPTFGGKPITLAGFFSGWPDRNLVVINAAAEQSALRVVFHEYAHFLVQNTSGRLPPWANEGLAGFYETFETRTGAKSALIGVPHEEHLALLRGSTLMPLRDLLAIDYSSPEYNEGNRRGLFYAESWALMHYLQLGNPSRASQLAAYLTRLHSGVDLNESFAASFGDAGILERELREYLRTFSFPALRLDFDARLGGTSAGPADVLGDVDRTTYLADLLARAGHVDEARARLLKLLDAHPDATAAAETLGVVELNAGNGDRALPWLERASHDRSDAAAQVLWGRAVIEQYEWNRGDRQEPSMSLNDAREALAHAAELRPDDPETLATLGRAESIAGEDVARALALLDRAVALAPGREEYRLMLSEELIRQREFTRATSLLGPLMANGKRPDVRETARRLLTLVSERENESPSRPATSAERAAAGPAPRFRVPRPDETRAVGHLTAVDCEHDRIVLHVDTDDQALRLAAADLRSVQFINYPGTTTAMACGAVEPPPRVFATYLESDATAQVTGVDGQAVAIEVLPDGYVNR